MFLAQKDPAPEVCFDASSASALLNYDIAA